MSIFQSAKIIAANYSSEKYHAENGERGTAQYIMSRSALMELRRCPHRWIKGFATEDTDATEWGSLLDTLLLTPSQFETRYAVRPDTYTSAKDGVKPWNNNATVCKEWNESVEAEGKKPLKKADLAEVQAALKSAKDDEIISSVLADCACQVYVVGDYYDEATGLTIGCKGLLDIVPGKDSAWRKSIWDLKSARNAAPGPWPRVVFERSYHVQAALSLDLYNAACPDEDRTDFCHAIIENVKPWEPGKRLISEDFLTLGRAQYRAALERYAKCLKSGEWPGYEAESRDVINGMTISQPESWMANP